MYELSNISLNCFSTNISGKTLEATATLQNFTLIDENMVDICKASFGIATIIQGAKHYPRDKLGGIVLLGSGIMLNWSALQNCTLSGAFFAAAAIGVLNAVAIDNDIGMQAVSL